MATQSQIDANRLNAQKSTGPRTEPGKAVSRFNALKTGIHAESEVIPGEDPAELENLAADYHQRFVPATPEECFLVDSLVDADWQMRRLRKARAQLWVHELKDAAQSAFGPALRQECALGHVFDRAKDNFVRLYRIIQAAERSYYRALHELTRLQSTRAAGPDLRPLGRPEAPAPSQPLVSSPQPASPELASFRNSAEPALPPASPVHPGPAAEADLQLIAGLPPDLGSFRSDPSNPKPGSQAR